MQDKAQSKQELKSEMSTKTKRQLWAIFFNSKPKSTLRLMYPLRYSARHQAAWNELQLRKA